MTIRLTAVRTMLAAAVVLAAAPSHAADREHQQIMADLRMLQEQANQLQVLMQQLGEALRAVNTRLDDHTGVERKAFADSKVQMDTISGDLRVVREKVDETNVRLGTISQELDSMRHSLPDPAAMTALPPAGDPADPAAAGAAVPPTVPPAGVQPGRTFDTAWADYTAGNYSLAVTGFQTYLSYFPRSPRAHEAQLYIGESYFIEKKNAEAVEAYDRVIAGYPGSASEPQAYYKRGMALQQMDQADRARDSFETVIKQYPQSQQASLARQRLESIAKPAR